MHGNKDTGRLTNFFSFVSPLFAFLWGVFPTQSDLKKMDRSYDSVIGHALTATEHHERLLLAGQVIIVIIRIWEVVLRKMTLLIRQQTNFTH